MSHGIQASDIAKRSSSKRFNERSRQASDKEMKRCKKCTLSITWETLYSDFASKPRTFSKLITA